VAFINHQQCNAQDSPGNSADPFVDLGMTLARQLLVVGELLGEINNCVMFEINAGHVIVRSEMVGDKYVLQSEGYIYCC
jgi:hypothetical protein